MANPETPPQGIYVAFDIQVTQGLRNLAKRIPSGIGEPIDLRDAHVAVVYPEEIANAGLAWHEIGKLREAESEILSQMGGLSIIGSTLRPAERTLQPYKKFAGVAIEPNDQMMDARRLSSDIIHEKLGIRIPQYIGSYHMSVARRPIGQRGAMPEHRIHYTKEQGFSVRGYTVGRRAVDSCFRYREPYMNTPCRATEPRRTFVTR